MTQDTRPRTRRHRGHRILLTMALCSLPWTAGCDTWQPPDSAAVYRPLPPEQVEVFDELFFNEVEDPLNGSARYGQDWKRGRKADFERMAAAGYAPAIAFMALWDFDQRARKPYSDRPMDWLKQRARQGDVSSACALWPIWSHNGRTPDPVEARAEFRPFVEMGLAAGHFACQTQAATALILAAGDKLTPESTELLLRAAAKGYYRAHWILAFDLRRVRPVTEASVNQSLCWSIVADGYRPVRTRFDLESSNFRDLTLPEFPATQAERDLITAALKHWKQVRSEPAPTGAAIDRCLALHGRTREANSIRN